MRLAMRPNRRTIDSSAPAFHLIACLALLLAAAPLPAAQEGEAPAESPPAESDAPQPLLALDAVTVRGPVEGEAPGPDTLVRLSVGITNRGEEIASAFAFTVEVAGRELPVYEKQVFLKPVPAGETVELALYNFWTSETGRPAPADGKLEVEVTLREARWMKRSVEKEGESEVEVWTPLGPVEGLPVTASTTVTLKKGA